MRPALSCGSTAWATAVHDGFTASENSSAPRRTAGFVKFVGQNEATSAGLAGLTPGGQVFRLPSLRSVFTLPTAHSTAYNVVSALCVLPVLKVFRLLLSSRFRPPIPLPTMFFLSLVFSLHVLLRFRFLACVVENTAQTFLPAVHPLLASVLTVLVCFTGLLRFRYLYWFCFCNSPPFPAPSSCFNTLFLRSHCPSTASPCVVTAISQLSHSRTTHFLAPSSLCVHILFSCTFSAHPSGDATAVSQPLPTFRRCSCGSITAPSSTATPPAAGGLCGWGPVHCLSLHLHYRSGHLTAFPLRVHCFDRTTKNQNRADIHKFTTLLHFMRQDHTYPLLMPPGGAALGISRRVIVRHQSDEFLYQYNNITSIW